MRWINVHVDAEVTGESFGNAAGETPTEYWEPSSIHSSAQKEDFRRRKFVSCIGGTSIQKFPIFLQLQEYACVPLPQLTI